MTYFRFFNKQTPYALGILPQQPLPAAQAKHYARFLFHDLVPPLPELAADERKPFRAQLYASLASDPYQQLHICTRIAHQWKAQKKEAPSRSPLANACLRRDFQAVLSASDQLPAFPLVDTNGHTLFDYAVMGGSLPLIHHLFTQSLSFPSNKFNSLHYAIGTGDLILAKYLLIAYPHLYSAPSPEVFLAALFLEDAELIVFLLQRGQNINSVHPTTGDSALHVACKMGSEKMVSLLLDFQADPFLTNKQGETPYEVAVTAQQLSVIYLLGSRLKPQLIKEPSYSEGVFLAIKCNAVPLLELLLDESTPKNLTDRKGWPVVHKAIYQGAFDAALFLIERKFSLNQRNRDGLTALHCLALSSIPQKLQLLDALLAAGEAIDARDEYGNTALMMAIQMGQEVSFILELLKKGADYHLLNQNLLSPYALALLFNQQEVREWLEKCSTPPAMTSLTASITFVEAIKRENLPLAFSLHDSGLLDNNYILQEESAAAHVIQSRTLSEPEKIDLLKTLLPKNKDATIEIPLQQGLVLLQLAAEANLLLVVRFLIDHGVNPANDDEGAALNGCLAHGNLSMVALLVEHGASMLPSDPDGEPPFLHALIARHEEIALFLLEKTDGVAPLPVCSTQSALTWSCKFGLKRVVEKLLSRRENSTVPSPRAWTVTPLQALLKGDEESPSPLSQEEIFQLTQTLLANDPTLLNQPSPGNLLPPLGIAIQKNFSLELISYFLQQGADTTFLAQDRVCWQAIYRNGRLDLYRLFSGWGIQPPPSTTPEIVELVQHSHGEFLKTVLPTYSPNAFSVSLNELMSLIPPSKEVERIIGEWSPEWLYIFLSAKIVKLLGHAFAISDLVSFKKFSLSTAGGLPSTYQTLTDFFKEFVDHSLQDPIFTDHARLKRATEGLFNPALSTCELVKRLYQGEPIMIQSGDQRHCIGLVFFKHPATQQFHLILSNRGVGYSAYHGLSMTTFFPPDDFEKVLTALRMVPPFTPYIQNFEEFKKQLKQLGIQPEQLTPLFSQYPQQGGFCVWNSLKGAFGALFYAEAILNGASSDTALLTLYRSYKAFTSYARNATLRLALNHFTPFSPFFYLHFNLQFIEKLAEKITGDPRIDPALADQLTRTIEVNKTLLSGICRLSF